MSATDRPGIRQWTIRALRRPWKIVSSNIYTDIKATAKIQFQNQPPTPLTSEGSELEHSDREFEADVEKAPSNPKRDKRPRSTSLFDKVTTFAGTSLVLFFTIAFLLGWMIIGIVLGPTQTWQIALQNTSSIQCYISDTLLMRQQHNDCRDLLTLICELRSRNITCRRLLQQIRHQSAVQERDCGSVPQHVESEAEAEVERKINMKANVRPIDDDVHLPARSLYDRICDPVVWAFGSLYASIIYWAGIFVWLGLGASPSLQWGNNWQLYINTATAVELTFVSIFLQNTRQRHMNYVKECFESIMHEDEHMERRLRQISGDTGPNSVVEIQYDYRRETTRGNRGIDCYAAIVGSGVGLFISAIVFSVWIGIGQPMRWNSNWWLIIGTYTGLVGFIDGFVLRNVYVRGAGVVDAQFRLLAEEDAALCEWFGTSLSLGTPVVEVKSLPDRIGSKVGAWCSRPEAVLGACVAVVAVLAIATGMSWSETGQLICNTPTMIVGGFLLLVLIQAHDITNRQRRLQVRDILTRRLAINSQIERL